MGLLLTPVHRCSSQARQTSGTPHANRLVGILHGCLKTRTLYDETTAWPHEEKIPQSNVAA